MGIVIFNALTSAFSMAILSRVVVQLSALVQIMVASRYFGLSEFGAYALAWACTVIFKTFIYTGYYQALLRSKAPKEDGPVIFGVMCLIAVVSACFSLIVGMLLRDTQPLAAQMFVALAFLPLIDALVAWNEVTLLRQRRMRTTTTTVALAEIGATLALVIVLMQGMGPLALVVARYVGVTLHAVVSTAVVRSWPGLALRTQVLARYWHTAFPLWVGAGAGMLTNYGADLVLGGYLSPQEVGAYRGGARISLTAADLVQQPLTMLSWSRFSRLTSSGRRRGLAQVWRVNLSFGAAVAWPVLTCVALLSTQIVTVVFDETWLPAADVILILCPVFAIRLMSSQLEPTLTSVERGYLQLRIRLFGLGLLILGLLLFGRYGAEAAALTQLATASVIAMIALWATKSVLSLTWGQIFRTFLPGAGLSLLCAGLVMLTEPMREALAPDWGLLLTVLLVACLWACATAAAVRRRLLRLPMI